MAWKVFENAAPSSGEGVGSKTNGAMLSAGPLGVGSVIIF
jgi:hypothetical protein